MPYRAPLSYGKKEHTLFLEKLEVLGKVGAWKPLLGLDVKNYWNVGTGRYFAVLIQHDMCFKSCSWQLLVKQRQMVSFPFECSAKEMESYVSLFAWRQREKIELSSTSACIEFLVPLFRTFFQYAFRKSFSTKHLTGKWIKRKFVNEHVLRKQSLCGYLLPERFSDTVYSSITKHFGEENRFTRNKQLTGLVLEIIMQSTLCW